MPPKKRIEKKIKKAKNVLGIIGHIIQDEDFLKMKKIRHHIFFNRYEHSLNVAKMCYSLANFFGADVETCTLAGLLHDFHHTYIKDSRHAVLAAKNSEKFRISRKVTDIIRSHMYPLGIKSIDRAKGLNFWIVKISDFVAPMLEIGYSLLARKLQYKDVIKFYTNRLIIELLDIEPEAYVLPGK